MEVDDSDDVYQLGSTIIVNPRSLFLSALVDNILVERRFVKRRFVERRFLSLRRRFLFVQRGQRYFVEQAALHPLSDRTDDILVVDRQRHVGLINCNYPGVKQEIYTQRVMLVISINSNNNIRQYIQCILISM